MRAAGDDMEQARRLIPRQRIVGIVIDSLHKSGLEGAEVIVSATRIPIPEEDSPASVSVITSDDLEQKQIRRVG